MSKDESKEVAVVEPSPAQLVSQAIAKGADPAAIEKLIDLVERMKASTAREAFVVALTDFQSQCPIIQKSNSVVVDGTERYRYAPMDVIVKEVRPLLHECGLSYKIDTEFKDGLMYATCIVTHELGHSESSTFMVPIDPKAFMNAPQKYASARTYATRYAFCGALGILTSDDDDDGNKAGDTSVEDEEERNPEPQTHHHGDEVEAVEPEPAESASGDDLIDANTVRAMKESKWLDDWEETTWRMCLKDINPDVKEPGELSKSDWKDWIDLVCEQDKRKGATKTTGGKKQRPKHKPGTPCPKCGSGTIVRAGKFGKFVACTGYPDCKFSADVKE